MNVWLLVLVAVLAFAAGLTVRELVEVFRPRRRTPLAPVVDLSVAAARGELIHLDWSDPRGAA